MTPSEERMKIAAIAFNPTGLLIVTRVGAHGKEGDQNQDPGKGAKKKRTRLERSLQQEALSVLVGYDMHLAWLPLAGYSDIYLYAPIKAF